MGREASRQEGREWGNEQGRGGGREQGREVGGETKVDTLLQRNSKTHKNTSTLLAGFERAKILDAFLQEFLKVAHARRRARGRIISLRALTSVRELFVRGYMYIQYACTCMYIYTPVYMYLYYICVYIYVYMYTYIH